MLSSGNSCLRHAQGCRTWPATTKQVVPPCVVRRLAQQHSKLQLAEKLKTSRELVATKHRVSTVFPYTQIQRQGKEEIAALERAFAGSSPAKTAGASLHRVFLGWAEDKGSKARQEDRHAFAALEPVSSTNCLQVDWRAGVELGRETFAYAAVFDGHGGHQTAAHAARQLHHSISKKMHTAVSMLDAIKHGFLSFDKEWHELTSGQQFDQSGSTAVVALVNKRNIIVGNAGDSVAVLARGGVAMRLSKLHHAEDLQEAERVMAAGGAFAKGKAGLRVMQHPATLPAGERYAKQPHVANTRSLGDFKLKRHNHCIVSSEPFVAELTVTLEDTLLMLVSDGITDVMADQEIVNVATEAMQQACTSGVDLEDQPHAAAAAIKAKALEKGAWDNLTALVIALGQDS